MAVAGVRVSIARTVVQAVTVALIDKVIRVTEVDLVLWRAVLEDVYAGFSCKRSVLAACEIKQVDIQQM